MSQDTIHDVLFIIRSHPQQVQSLLDDLDNRAELEKTTGPEQLSIIIQFVQQQNTLYSSILNCTKQLGQILLIQYTTKGTLSWKDPPVQWLFHLLHQILKHGFKIKRNLFGYKKSYWDFIWTGYQYTPKTNSTLEDYPGLSNKIQSLSAQVTSISGIVFIIHSLINQRLDQRLGLLVNQPQLLKDWYEPYAFILQDQMVLFNGLLVILNNIKFDLGFQHEFLLELNEIFSGESMSEVTLAEWLPKLEVKLKDQLNDGSDSQSEAEDDVLFNNSKDGHVDKEIQELVNFQMKEEHEPIINIENHSSGTLDESLHGIKEVEIPQSKVSPLDIHSSPLINHHLSSSASPTSFIAPLSPKVSTSLVTYIKEEDQLPPMVILPKLNDKEIITSIQTQSNFAHISESLFIPLPKSPEQSNSTIEYSPKSLPPDQISLPPSIDSLDDKPESEHPDIVHWKRHVEKLESEIVTLRKINFSHLTKLNSIQFQNAELNTMLKIKDSELLDSKFQLSKFDTSKMALESKLAESNHQIEYLSEQLEHKNTHIQQLNQKLTKSNNENIEYQNVSQSLSHKIKQMEEQIEQLCKANSELKNQKDQLENKVHHQDSMLELFAMEMAQSKLNLKDLEVYVGNQNNKIPWVDSQLVTKCTKCQAQFTMINRKHHCRRDGKVYCNNCTKFRWTLPSDPKPSRVCEDCYLELTDAK